MPTGPYFVWTPEAVARLRGLSATHTAKEIAAALGCTYDAARSKLTNLGVQRPFRMHWTPERLDELLALSAEGLTARQVAARMGTTVSAVRSQVRNGKPVDRSAAPIRHTVIDRAERMMKLSTRLTTLHAWQKKVA